jgi:hypothetical protein
MVSHQLPTNPVYIAVNYDGYDMLICRQVDDMLLAGTDAYVVKEFAKDISSKLKVTCGDTPSKHFNGLDI